MLFKLTLVTCSLIFMVTILYDAKYSVNPQLSVKDSIRACLYVAGFIVLVLIWPA